MDPVLEIVQQRIDMGSRNIRIMAEVLGRIERQVKDRGLRANHSSHSDRAVDVSIRHIGVGDQYPWVSNSAFGLRPSFQPCLSEGNARAPGLALRERTPERKIPARPPQARGCMTA